MISLIRRLIYLMIFSSFLGASLIAINMGIFQLSLYRMFLLLIAFLIIITYLVKPQLVKILPSGKSKTIVLFYLLWLLWAFISVAWVNDYNSWIKAVYFITSGVLAIIYCSMFFRKENDFVTAFNIMQVMLIAHNVIGWYELITSDYRFLSGRVLDYYTHVDVVGRNPISMMGNTNDFALLVSFGVFISFICFKNSKSIFWKLISTVTIMSCITLNLMTDSRANILGLIIALWVYVFVYFYQTNNIKKYVFTGVLISILALYPSIASNIYNTISQRLQFDFVASSGSLYVRLNLMKNGFVFLQQTFGLGTGAGNIEYWMANRALYDTGHITNMHNWWMELLVGYGVLIFTVYLWVFIRLLRSFYSAYIHTHDKFIKSASLGLLCCMIQFVVGSVSSSSNISSEWLWVFWGVAVSMYYYIETTAKINNKKEFNKVRLNKTEESMVVDYL